MGRIIFFGVLALLVAFAVGWVLKTLRGTGDVKRLREQYLLATGLPLGQAYDQLERHLERLMEKAPGQPMSFYLHSALAELKRDRR